MDPPLGLADQAHLPQNRLTLPVFQSQPKSPGRHIALSYRFHSSFLIVHRRLSQKEMLWRGFWSTTNDGGNHASILKGQAQLQVKLGMRYRSQGETCLGAIVQMRAHVGKVDQRHFVLNFRPGELARGTTMTSQRPGLVSVVCYDIIQELATAAFQTWEEDGVLPSTKDGSLVVPLCSKIIGPDVPEKP